MKIEQIYTGCLAEAAYYIESDGEVAIIDPLRETAPYLKRAAKDNAVIKYIFETHFHADFVSGHIDLAEKSKASIVFGPTAVTSFPSHIAQDHEKFQVGKLTITTLHTPGHTPESTTYLLADESGKPYCIFTGDTLFIGDVGRPDIAQMGTLTMEDMAATLYDSLQEKILTLPDGVLVYPAHGAGSACGKHMSKETFDTLGHQKEVNYALNATSKMQFIKEVTDGILPPPQYFAKNAAMNRNGYERFDEVYDKGLTGLDANEFESIVNQLGAIIIDTRDPQAFASGFIPSSVNIGLNGQFAPWVGALITDLEQPILLVAEQGKEKEAITRLLRVGYDSTIGYLDGGIDAWKKVGKDLETIDSISAADFAAAFGKEENFTVLDVRKPGEYESEHLEISLSRPLDYINDWTAEIDPKKTYYIHCEGGYRSMIAASILKARGVDRVIDVQGGYSAIKVEEQNNTDYDVLIIGAGPIGMACAIEALNAGLTYIIIEKGALVNSLYNYPVFMTFFSTSQKLEIGGVPFVSISNKPNRNEALEYYRRVAEKFALKINLFEAVKSVIKKADGNFVVKTDKAAYKSKKVIISTGFYDVPVMMNIPGEELPKVRHYYQDPHLYAFSKILVIGANNSAIDVALETYRKGAQVTLVVRGSEIGSKVKYWVRPDIENRIKEGDIKAYFNSEIATIAEQEVQIKTPEGLITIANDFVLAMTGYKPDFDLLKNLGVRLEDNNCPVHNPHTMETSEKGLYLAGVVCGGMDTHKWFIENSRVHAEQIIAHIKGN